MQAFYLKTRIYSGPDGLKEAIGDARRIFLVTDVFLAQSGKSAYITDRLKEGGKDWLLFSEVEPNPDTESISRGVFCLLEYGADCIIAFGGGSALDAAKGIRYFAGLEGGGSLRLIAVPTTSGTGSEVSSFAVISNRKKGEKYPLVSEELLPDAAVLDSALVHSAPPSVTADTGLDVLTHALEAYVAAGANDFTDAAAEKAFLLVKEHLVAAWRSPQDAAAREGMHHASCLAGMAFANAGLGLNHGMAHAMGERLHIPHGRANALLLPKVLAFNAFGNGQEKDGRIIGKYARLAFLGRMEGYDEAESVRRLIRYVRQLCRQLALPESIKEAGVGREDFAAALPHMTEAALQDPCSASNPRRAERQEVEALFVRAYEGGGMRTERGSGR